MDPLKELKTMLEGIKEKVENGQTSVTDVQSTVANIGKKLEELDNWKKEVDAKIQRNTLPGLKEELKKTPFSIFKVIRSVVTGQWKDAEYEQKIMTDFAAHRAMAAGTGSAGGYIVPPEVITDMIELQRASSVVIAMGASVMDGLMGSPVEMPKQTGGATAYWVAENSAITGSDLTFGQLTMSPKQVAALVKLSARLIKLSNPGAEQIVRNDLSIALGLAIDLAALRGAGGANEPTGIANTASINTVALGADGAVATFDDLLDMEGTVEDNNALASSAGSSLGYVMHTKVKRLLKKAKVAQYSGDTKGQYLILPMSDTNMRDILGYDFRTTTQVPTNLTKGSGTALSEIYFGNWRDLLIGNWGGLELASSNVAGDNNGGAFSSNQVWVRAIQEVDVAVRNPKSFCLINDAKTTA